MICPRISWALTRALREIVQHATRNNYPAVAVLQGDRQIVAFDYWERRNPTELAIADEGRRHNVQFGALAVHLVVPVTLESQAPTLYCKPPITDEMRAAGMTEALFAFGFDLNCGYTLACIPFVRRPNGELVLGDQHIVQGPLAVVDQTPGYRLLNAMTTDPTGGSQ